MKFITLILTVSAVSNAIALPGENSEGMLFSNDSHSGTKEPKSTKNSQNVPYYARPTVNSIKLQNLINTEELNASAWDLFELSKLSIPTYGHPTRVVGSPGHWATLDYIHEQLYKMKDYYDISSQYFSALIGEIVSFNLTYTNGEDVPTATAFSLSPSVKRFRGKLVHIPNYGCNDADYRGFRQDLNQIALIERGECSFGAKSSLAGKHGFRGAVIYDNDPENDKGLRGTLGKPDENTIATIGVSYQAGSVLIAAIRKYKDYPLYFAMQSNIKEVVTKNIIADTKHGDPENIVSLGAHTDSVSEGPGINDDGSGTISLLTVAKHLTEFQVNNKVRFAWWSAEEYGLLGSNYYANTLSPEENAKIRLFMDYDMMASPNAEFQVYDGNNVDHPVGCEELKNMYIKYYERYNLNYTLIPFDGRSDYVGFIQNNIPAGGVATGAEKINPKNGEPFDKCYHQLCDDVTNLNMSAFLVNTKLIAHSVAHYANSLEGFPLRQGYDTSNAVTSPELRFLYSGSRLIG